jgi:homoserine O-succinyltransferase/O-acetyltransferase
VSVLIRGDQVEQSPLVGRGVAGLSGSRGARIGHDRVIEIGLLNNMPDAALEATERQFMRLLAAAAGNLTVRVHFLSLPAIPRGEAARSRLRRAYACTTELPAKDLDGLIVTGTEPRATSLKQEPYWNRLADLIDWAEHNTISTIWSCLAAHAAVLHLDGIRRHTLADKRFGLFACKKTSHPSIMANLPPAVHLPHSRWNELKENDLVTHGYHILTRSREAGVDIFIKKWRSLFIFFQGHPEYDADTLLREYRRDVGRFLRGERDNFPTMPEGYFTECGERTLRAFQTLCRTDRRSELFLQFPEKLTMRPRRVLDWQASAKSLFGNWLSYIHEQKW